MGCIIDGGQALKIEGCVNLGAGNAGMAQQLLHRPQVTTGLQEMAGKRMAQHMGVHTRGNAKG
jgi:hypothetical protein